jgi:hypothetical protein
MSTSSRNSVRAKHLEIESGYLWIFLDDGRVLRVPTADYPRLAHASKKQLKNFEWIGRGLGIHWPDLDEDLSIEGFLHSRTKPKFFVLSSPNQSAVQTVRGLTLLPIRRYQEKIKERIFSKKTAN